MKHLIVTIILSAVLIGGVAQADDNTFATEFVYSQQKHPKARGRLKEGYNIRSYFHFLVPLKDREAEWAPLQQNYLAKVRQGFTNLPMEGEAGNSKATAKAMLPCDVQYIFSKAKGIERKGKSRGFDGLSSPERAVYNFSKKYIRDPQAITFSRKLSAATEAQWSAIARHYEVAGKPVLALSEQLDNFNQFAIDGSVVFLVTPHSETEAAVHGEISLTLDADILDQRVIGLLLSLPVKATLKGLLPTKVVFNRVVEKLKSVDTGAEFQCLAGQSGDNSLIYGVPNFAHGYLKSLRQHLSSGAVVAKPELKPEPKPESETSPESKS